MRSAFAAADERACKGKKKIKKGKEKGKRKQEGKRRREESIAHDVCRDAHRRLATV